MLKAAGILQRQIPLTVFTAASPIFFHPHACKGSLSSKEDRARENPPLCARPLLRLPAPGESVEYYYCSSDTSSLDGIVLKHSGTAILDGTSPHTTDPAYPGAVEEIINMGDFFQYP